MNTFKMALRYDHLIWQSDETFLCLWLLRMLFSVKLALLQIGKLLYLNLVKLLKKTINNFDATHRDGPVAWQSDMVAGRVTG